MVRVAKLLIKDIIDVHGLLGQKSSCSLETSVFAKSYGAGVPYKQRVGEIRGIYETELVIDPVFGKDALGISVVFRVIRRQESDIDNVVVYCLHDGIAYSLGDLVRASGDRVRRKGLHLLNAGVFRFGVCRRFCSALPFRGCGCGAGCYSGSGSIIGGTAV